MLSILLSSIPFVAVFPVQEDGDILLMILKHPHGNRACYVKVSLRTPSKKFLKPNVMPSYIICQTECIKCKDIKFKNSNCSHYYFLSVDWSINFLTSLLLYPWNSYRKDVQTKRLSFFLRCFSYHSLLPLFKRTLLDARYSIPLATW